MSDDRRADPDDPAPQRRGLRAHERTVAVAVGVGAGLLLAQATAAVFARVQGLLAIVVVSLFLSFAMEPAVQWLARRGARRGVATGLVFVGGLLITGALGIAVGALLVDQVRTLTAAGPFLLDQLAGQLQVLLPGEIGDGLSAWLDEQQRQLPAALSDVAGALGRGAIGVGQSLIGGLFQLATIGLVTFYLVADGPRLRRRLAGRLAPRDQIRVLGLWELAIAKTGGYVYGRALTAFISSVAHVAAFTLLGLEYAVALGVFVGVVSSLIPAIGTYLAGALPVIVALASEPTLALWVLGVIVVYQQIENYLVVPRITAVTLELHPAVAFLSVLAGAALAGAFGALLAIPAAAIATALVGASAEEYDVLEHELLESTAPARHRRGGGTASGRADRQAARAAAGHGHRETEPGERSRSRQTP